MNFVEFLCERSRDSDLIAGVKGALSSRELHEKVERFSGRTAWQYVSGKELLVLSGSSGFPVLDMPLSSSNKVNNVRIREMPSRGEIPVR